jgi:signal transduction histidine kinase
VRLVEQLLTLARSEPGAALAPAEAVDLGELAREVLAAMHPFAHDRGSELVLDAEPSVVVHGERNALAALVRNLVDNAIRYSPAGSLVEVRVRNLEGAAVLQIDDAGPGIPDADRERVFDRFYRRSENAESGSGLGLAIVRSVTAAHGASIELARSARGGLSVSVRFPGNP